MERKRKQLRKPVCRRLSVLLICALILGMLPVQAVQVRASESEAAAEQNAKAGQSTLINPIIGTYDATTWDTIYFGSYWQNDTNGDGTADQNDDKEPIRWRVLSVDGDDVFLLADQNLDCQPYNDVFTTVTWERCTLRSWLNNTFLNNAFTAAEQSAIRETLVENPDNSLDHGTKGGNDTTDKVYLLSVNEVTNPEYGFLSDYYGEDVQSKSQSKSRMAKNTDYAKEQGVYTKTYGKYAGNGGWWLRSSGRYSCYAVFADAQGCVNWPGTDVDGCVPEYLMNGDDSYNAVSYNAVRPALHLNLSSAAGWSYGGRVNAKGTYGQPPSNPITGTNNVTTWDTIYFGSYWQNDTNGDGTADQNDDKEPIRWRVLSVDGDDAFLLADQNLDCQPYHDTDTDVTWETCTLRSWLNDTFLNNAFTAAEQSAIRETLVKNQGNTYYETEGGNDTTDRVYLLSVDEVSKREYGFASGESMYEKNRMAKNTDYARGQGAYTVTDGKYTGIGRWWLRSPGSSNSNASYVDSKGGVSHYVYDDRDAVRPALHLNLSSVTEWSYGGIVNFESTYEQPPSPSPTATEIPASTPIILPTASPAVTAEPMGSGAPATLNNPIRDANDVTTWDTIYFGSYWQNDTNGDGTADRNDDKEPIRWRVLSVDGDDVFLLADQNLDCQPYHDTYTDVTWETCTLRSWLNDTFLNNAFTSAEQSAIRETLVENLYETGNDTTDQVYLLSRNEVNNPDYGFSARAGGNLFKRRVAKNTDYAKAQGAYTETYGKYAGNGYWWFRSLYRHAISGDICVECVGYDGVVAEANVILDVVKDLNGCHGAVRPALHLNLSSATGWSYGGKVNSEGAYEQPSSPSPTASPTVTEEPMGSGVQAALNNPTTDDNGVTTWDAIYFGSYWQKDTNGDGIADQNDEKKPIRWRVLSVDGDDVFLLADRNLDWQPYHNTITDVTWETCTLRSWLNDTFLNNAFTSAEQSAIRETLVKNPDNSEYGTEGGNDTTDQVYLLSPDEVTNPEYGFSSGYYTADKSRMAKNTDYVKEQGYTITYGECVGSNRWWLRSPGHYSNFASDVEYAGGVNVGGISVNSSSRTAVRPALHLNLSSATGWSYGGRVNSEGTYEQPPTPGPTATAIPTSTPIVLPTASPAVTAEPMGSSVPTASPAVTAEPMGSSVPTASPAVTAEPMESDVPAALNNPTTDDGGVTTWDTIYFGSYWQNDTNGDGTADRNDDKEPIRWRVLSVDGDNAFLLADQNLDCQPYHDTDTDVTWKTCTLRSWLNDTFLNNAFTAAEQSVIRETLVENPDNPAYGTEGGNDTTDQVYLLSFNEVTNPEYGFSSDYNANDKSTRAKNTAYAKEQGVYTETGGEYAGNGTWWLRSPGYYSNFASDVTHYGSVYRHGHHVYYANNAVRPALRLNLSSAAGWSYGGRVNSESTYEQLPSPTATAIPTSTPIVPPTVSPAVTTKPSAGPDEPSTEPTVTVCPSEEPTQMPGETLGSPTIKPNDNTQPQPSGSASDQPAGTQSPNSSKSEENEGTKQDATLSQLKVGTVLTISGIQYKVQSTSEKKKTVVLFKVTGKKLKKATIPSTIKYKSETYEVVKISKNAFKGCKSLKKVTIGSKVKEIGSGAFSGCKKLNTVTIRSKVLKKIEMGAFAGVNPKAKLKAPKSKISQYRRLMKKAGWHE